MPLSNIVHLSGSLMDRTTVKDVARALGLNYVKSSTGAADLPVLLRDNSNAFVVDISYLGSEGMRLVFNGLSSKDRVLGYCSHVDRELIAQAQQAGIEVMPRSKFFLDLQARLSGLVS